VGKDFSYKLQKLGMLAIEEADTHAQLAFAATLGENDVVFAISESGNTKEIITVVSEAKRNKSKNNFCDAFWKHTDF